MSETGDSVGEPKDAEGESQRRCNCAACLKRIKSRVSEIIAPLTYITDVGFFTAVLAVVAALQWSTLEKTNRTLEDSLKTNNISQRAFVYTTLLQSYISPNPLTDPQAINFVFGLVNGGNTPTRGLKFFIRCAPSDKAYGDPWPLLEPDKTKETPGFIGPKATVTVPCSFTFTQIQKIAAGNSHGYVLLNVMVRFWTYFRTDLIDDWGGFGLLLKNQQ